MTYLLLTAFFAVFNIFFSKLLEIEPLLVFFMCIVSGTIDFLHTNFLFKRSLYAIDFKGTASPDFEVFFIIYDIKSVLSVWTLMVYNFFIQGFILIFIDEVLMYMTLNAS